MRLRSGAVAVAALALAGCGGDDPETQIADLMTELRQAQRGGDAERACEEVYVVRERGAPASGRAKRRASVRARARRRAARRAAARRSSGPSSISAPL